MLNISPFRMVLIWLTVAVGLLLALPNAFYGKVESYNDTVVASGSGEGWPGFLPSGLVNLGLDLRGGAHLLAEVEVEDVYQTMIDVRWPEVRDALAAERDTVGFVTREDSPEGVLRVRISESAGADRALQIVRELAQPVQGLSGAGSSDIEVAANGSVLTITLSEAEKAGIDERTMGQALEIVRNRIDEAGTREPSIQR
ncbi:MAG: protein translocase subunit SecD, partial [Loktanella sp.]|nr:protein translocase subunit SecD [Loktanella sp.]